MATLYEKLNTGDTTDSLAVHLYYRGQSFTPSIAHTITSVKLLLYRVGLPGTMAVSIRATDVDGKPTGADLCSGSTDGDTLPTGSPYEWREITLGAGTTLTAGTKYAIVLAPTSNGNNPLRLVWCRGRVDSAYANGTHLSDDTSGTVWDTPSTTNDLMFEDWGNPVFIPRIFIT